jgi:hypothetical protein
MESVHGWKNPRRSIGKNYLLLNPNDPCEIADISWIRSGKVLLEVSLIKAFAEADTEFISPQNMQYVEFHGGWYGPENNDLSDEWLLICNGHYEFVLVAGAQAKTVMSLLIITSVLAGVIFCF